MIKRILPFVSFLLLQLSPAANAQVVKNSPIAEAREHRWDLPPAQRSAEKATDVKGSRLLRSAVGYYANSSFPFKDSTFNQYSPTRGQHPILGWMYDTATTITKYPHITRFSSRTQHFFNSAGNIADMDVQWWDSTGNAWYTIAKIKHDYTNGKLLSSVQSNLVSGVWTPVVKTEYYTNTITNTSTTLRQEWDVTQSKWLYKAREVTKYNSMGPDTIWKENYTASAWVPEKITAYTYVNGKATLISRTVKVGSGWSPDYKETNTYNGNGEKTETVFESYNQLGGSWNDPVKEEYSYDTDGNLSETVLSNWVSGSYQRTSKQTQTYNSYKQVLTNTSQTWDVNFSQWIYTANDIQYRNHYEEYTTGISKIEETKTSIRLYPIPATNKLNIELTNIKTPLTISILDMQGRVVKYMPAIEPQMPVVDMSVSDLMNGIYLLKLESASGKILKQLSIVR